MSQNIEDRLKHIEGRLQVLDDQQVIRPTIRAGANSNVPVIEIF